MYIEWKALKPWTIKDSHIHLLPFAKALTLHRYSHMWDWAKEDERVGHLGIQRWDSSGISMLPIPILMPGRIGTSTKSWEDWCGGKDQGSDVQGMGDAQNCMFIFFAARTAVFFLPLLNRCSKKWNVGLGKSKYINHGIFCTDQNFSERSPSLFLYDGWDVHIKEARLAATLEERSSGLFWVVPLSGC